MIGIPALSQASGYTAQLIDSDGKVLASANGPELETMQSAEVELQYLPKLAGKMIVKGKIAFDQDEDASNNTTEPVEQTVVPEGSKYITITSTPAKAISVVPASFYSNETLTETIYPASHFYRKMKTLTNQSPHNFLRNIRMKQAARLFDEGHQNVTEVMYAVGYNNANSFSVAFKAFYGVAPWDYIKNEE